MKEWYMTWKRLLNAWMYLLRNANLHSVEKSQAKLKVMWNSSRGWKGEGHNKPPVRKCSVDGKPRSLCRTAQKQDLTTAGLPSLDKHCRFVNYSFSPHIMWRYLISNSLCSTSSNYAKSWKIWQKKWRLQVLLNSWKNPFFVSHRNNMIEPKLNGACIQLTPALKIMLAWVGHGSVSRAFS